MKTTRLALAALFALPAFAKKPVTPGRDFVWGVGNSAFQVEGQPLDSDWRQWTRTPGKIKDGTNAEIATDFWNRYEEDLDLAKKLGAGVFRISIAWERVETKQGVWDEAALDHYERILVAMRARGLEPLVTIHHFVIPAWLYSQGGAEAKDYPKLFARYAEKVVRRLSKKPARVKWWMTMNEPMGQAFTSFMAPLWPPGVQDPSRAAVAAANFAEAHVRAYKAIRAIPGLPADVKIGVAANWPVMEVRGTLVFDSPLGYLANWSSNYQWVNAVQSGNLDFWVPAGKPVQRKIAVPKEGTLDFLGINYYARKFMRVKPLEGKFLEYGEGPGPKSDIGWEMYPEGLYQALKSAWRYRLPILVSENGVADADDKWRGWFLKENLKQIARARKKGIDVFGYVHWSLTDNFEWAEGESMRFGLVEVDYKTLEKTPRKSFGLFRDLIRQGME